MEKKRNQNTKYSKDNQLGISKYTDDIKKKIFFQTETIPFTLTTFFGLRYTYVYLIKIN